MKTIGLLFGLSWMIIMPAAFASAAGEEHWVGTWACSPQLVEPGNRPPAPGLNEATLRQIVHVSLGGKTIRVRLSNAFGNAPLVLSAVHIAQFAGGNGIKTGTDRALTFEGKEAITIPTGAAIVSDPIAFDLAPLSSVVLTVHVNSVPDDITGHPGSRTTSYLVTGDLVSAETLPTTTKADHWYFITGLDVRAEESAAAIVVLGDSITDGRGSTTNGNDRWPDQLARRLQSDSSTAGISVLNHGIGGNRILRNGLGPDALSRFDRDVLAQPGARWLIVLEGVNDIGTAVSAAAKGEPGATAPDLIAAFEQMITQAHAHGLRVFGATIMPFDGFTSYFRPESEAARQAVNQWIRTSGRFDAVIDFDAVTRDPQKPSSLSAAVDGGDHLHPSAAGYKIMADAIDLKLFAR